MTSHVTQSWTETLYSIKFNFVLKYVKNFIEQIMLEQVSLVARKIFRIQVEEFSKREGGLRGRF